MADKGSTPHPSASVLERFVPGLAALIRYEASWLKSDMAAGLSVAAVALPVGIAYSDLAGVPPVIGMYAAIFPLFAYALFGSSRQLMTGPDAATCIMAAAILGPIAGGDPARYQALLVVLTLMTGILYVIAGFGRLGFLANFLSLPILTGFLNGIALIIIVGQVSKLLGYHSEAGDFIPKIAEIFERVGDSHPPTMILGGSLLVLLVVIRRLLPRMPHPLVIVIVGIGAVLGLGLDERGVAILGTVPKGLPPAFEFPAMTLAEIQGLLRDAAGLMLVSFTSGILTAKSFAQRNRYEIDASQDLIAFGACNLASGLAQGFPVTGADSRTAVNNAMGGKSQMAGIVAAGAMLLILLFLTAPLALVPTTALAAVIIVSATGLIDIDTLRQLKVATRVEMGFSIATTIAVLTLGVLPGVLIAVVLSLVMLLAISSRPPDAVLGKVPGIKGFHSIQDYPEAKTVPGLVLYRFNANIVFYNADYFRERILAAIARSPTPVEWVIVDASPINVVDMTAVVKIGELRQQLADRGITLGFARRKIALGRHFETDWFDARMELLKHTMFPTLKSAMRAFDRRQGDAPTTSPSADG